MTQQPPRRDLEETDVYEVAMLPEPRPRPAPPPLPARAQVEAPATAQASPPATPGAAPAWSVPAAPPQVITRPPPQAWPGTWPAPYDTSALAILAATTLLIFGIVEAILLGFLLAIWDAVARLSLGVLVQLQTVESTRIVMIVLLVVAIMQIVAAIGVFAHRGWARLLGIAICVPGTVAATIFLVAATSSRLTSETWLAALLLGAYGFSFFGLIAGNSHFRRLARRY